MDPKSRSRPVIDPEPVPPRPPQFGVRSESPDIRSVVHTLFDDIREMLRPDHWQATREAKASHAESTTPAPCPESTQPREATEEHHPCDIDRDRVVDRSGTNVPDTT